MAFNQLIKKPYQGKHVLTRQEKRSRRQNLLLILFAAFLITFIVSGILFLTSYSSAKEEKQAFEELAELVNRSEGASATTVPEASPLPDNTGSYEPPQDETSILASLVERNSDFCGWLSISETNINYPVMLTPNDPEYYLRRDFDQNDSVSGVPFIGDGCDLSSDNIIIYGHNMKNGTMFSDLTKYSEKEYMESHGIISFDTLEGPADYEVIAAFQDRVHYQDEKNVFRYYEYGGSLTAEQFINYVKNVMNLSFYDTGVDVEYGDQLLTLSTCAYHVKDGRFVVVAKRVMNSNNPN